MDISVGLLIFGIYLRWASLKRQIKDDTISNKSEVSCIH